MCPQHTQIQFVGDRAWMDARAALLCHMLSWPVVKPGCEDENTTDAQVPGMGRGLLGKEMGRVSSALRPRAKERAQCL